MYRKYSSGIIEVVTGPMFSGKTEELIKRITVLSYSEIPTLIVKPVIDNRFSHNEIFSRNGRSIKCYSVDTVYDIKELFRQQNYKALVIDEAQFFDESLIDFVEELAVKGIRVIACGLDQDFRRKPFKIIANLMAIADQVTKLKAVCLSCKNAASCSFRTSLSQETIEIGDTNKYEARCRLCHQNGLNHQKNKKIS